MGIFDKVNGKDKISDAKVVGHGNYIPRDFTNVHSVTNVIATFDVEIREVTLGTTQNTHAFLAVKFRVLGCSAPEFIKLGDDYDWFIDSGDLPFFSNCKQWGLAVMQGMDGGEGVTEGDIDGDVLKALTSTADKKEDNINLVGHRLRMRTFAKKMKEQRDPNKVSYFLGTQWSPASQAHPPAPAEIEASAK